jgi:hypothetical protein
LKKCEIFNVISTTRKKRSAGQHLLLESWSIYSYPFILPSRLVTKASPAWLWYLSLTTTNVLSREWLLRSLSLTMYIDSLLQSKSFQREGLTEQIKCNPYFISHISSMILFRLTLYSICKVINSFCFKSTQVSTKLWKYIQLKLKVYMHIGWSHIHMKWVRQYVNIM